MRYLELPIITRLNSIFREHDIEARIETHILKETRHEKMSPPDYRYYSNNPEITYTELDFLAKAFRNFYPEFSSVISNRDFEKRL